MTTYQKQVNSYIDCIDYLIHRKHHIPALTLIYSLIDHLAFLDSVNLGQDVTRSDYKNWCEKYMNVEVLEIDSIDLYAARCALLHAGIAESNLSRKREANQIFYYWGNKTKENMQSKFQNADGSWILKEYKDQTYRFLKIEDLFEELKKGITSFNIDIESDESKIAQVNEKQSNYLVNTV